jgi:hypothetical protein
MNCSRLKVPSLSQCFLGKELINEGRRRLPLKGVEWGMQNPLTASRESSRQESLGQLPLEILVLEPTHLPARVQPSKKFDQILVQERVARLHAGVMRRPVSARLEVQSSQVDAGSHVNGAVEGMPARHPRTVQTKVLIRNVVIQCLANRLAEEPFFVGAHQVVNDQPGVGPRSDLFGMAECGPVKIARVYQVGVRPEPSTA